MRSRVHEKEAVLGRSFAKKLENEMSINGPKIKKMSIKVVRWRPGLVTRGMRSELFCPFAFDKMSRLGVTSTHQQHLAKLTQAYMN